MLSRKAMMLGVAAAAMAPSLSRAQVSNISRQAALDAALLRPDTLAYHAAKAGLLFGSMIGRDFFSDPDYEQLVSRECSLICATLIVPGVTRRSQSGFDFRSGDQQVAFATANKLAVYGGYLIVHGDEPAWITPTTDRAVALAELQRIVTATMTHYAGQLDYWIVVNEAVAPDGLRGCTWLATLGPDYIAQAFRAARQADPNAVLVLNENNIETSAVNAVKKRAVMLDLVTSLLKSGVPIDGVGMQAHLPADKVVDVPALESFANSIHALGLKIMITELDVFDATLPADVGARDSAVAQTLTNFLKPLLQHPGVESISAWGLSDSHSWYNKASNPPSLKRQDGRPSRGALFDEDLRKKPAYLAIRAALDGATRS